MSIDDEYELYHGLEEPYDPDEAYEAHQDGLTIERLRKMKPWSKAPGSLAIDLALMQKGGMFKRQA